LFYSDPNQRREQRIPCVLHSILERVIILCPNKLRILPFVVIIGNRIRS
jgi:hypothetical protein